MSLFRELEAALPWGLHDAYLDAMSFDFVANRVVLDVRVIMDERQTLERGGRVTVDGLAWWHTVAHDPSSGWRSERGLWMQPHHEVRPEVLAAVLPPVPSGCVVQGIFFSTNNSDLYLCARSARFEFTSPTDEPVQSSTGFAKPGDEIPDP